MAERRAPPTRSTATLFASLVALSLALLAAVLLRPSPAARLITTSPARARMPPPPPYPHTRGRTLRIGSLNLRYDYHARHPVASAALSLGAKVGLGSGSGSGADGERERYGERRWQERREALLDAVRWEELDVLGCQEALWSQVGDLTELLGDDEWGFVGVGRDDGRHKGEAVPIFWRRSRLTLLSASHHWLSPTPDKPGSKGWDAGQPRMVTIARFGHREAGAGGSKSAQLVVANTHWDDRGLEARTQSARLILRLVEDELAAARAQAGPGGDDDDAEPLVVLLGDLNSPAEEDGYQVLTGRRYPEGAASTEEEDARPSFFDARHELAVRGSALAGPGALSSRFGPLNTFTGFTASDVPKVIDFVLPYANAAFLPLSSTPPASSSSSSSAQQPRWKVARYGVVPSFFEDLGGRRPEGDEGTRDAMVRSDHRLVVARFEEVLTAREAVRSAEGKRGVGDVEGCETAPVDEAARA